MYFTYNVTYTYNSFSKLFFFNWKNKNPSKPLRPNLIPKRNHLLNFRESEFSRSLSFEAHSKVQTSNTFSAYYNTENYKTWRCRDSNLCCHKLDSHLARCFLILALSLLNQIMLNAMTTTKIPKTRSNFPRLTHHRYCVIFVFHFGLIILLFGFRFWLKEERNLVQQFSTGHLHWTR
jgi:hypothetical protein